MLANRAWDRARWLTWMLVVVALGPAWAEEGEAPAAAPPPAASSREAIEKALSKQVDWSFCETPLSKVAEQAQKDLGIPILLDQRSLEEQAIGLDSPITWKHPGLTADAALRCLLRDLNLVVFSRDEFLLITTPESQAEHLQTEVYDVAGLLSPEETKAIEEEATKTDNKASDGEDAKQRKSPPPTRGTAALLRLIQALESCTWEEVGGTGTLRFLCVEETPRLIVSQTQDVQRSIARFLATLRKMQQDASIQSLEIASESQRQAEETIRKALGKRVDVAFKETPLADVAAWFGKTLEVPVRLDQRALEEHAIAAETPITFQLRNGSARMALEQMLEQLGLTWTIGPEVLSITTPEEASENLVTRVYNIADLSKQLAGGAEPGDPCHKVVETIMATVQPSTWQEVGGAGEAIVYRGPDLTVLVVLQTMQTHEEIESLLTRLREGVASGK